MASALITRCTLCTRISPQHLTFCGQVVESPAFSGGLAERLMAAVLKTESASQAFECSNHSPSASFPLLPHCTGGRIPTGVAYRALVLTQDQMHNPEVLLFLCILSKLLILLHVRVCLVVTQ
jgi:hypothetical protein